MSLWVKLGVKPGRQWGWFSVARTTRTYAPCDNAGLAAIIVLRSSFLVHRSGPTSP
ncbi:MAG: hypothetical protein MUD01_10445 [Chloroflexaceae bacterium]|nr:hypothetical protein [Chloroflexaceae bacterium]